MNNKIILNTRQKLVIGLTILTFAVLIWQVYSLVHSDIAPTNAELTTPSTSANPALSNNLSTAQTNNDTNTLVNNNMTTAQVNTTNSVDQPKLVTQLPEDTIQRRSNLALNQQQYMKTANQYELAKMQRQLLEEQVAIANARRSIADTEQQTQKILGGDNGSFSGIEDGSETPMRLSYLSQRDGKWHATILRNGIYHSVVVGTTLQNMSKVLYINQQGVKLKQHGRIFLLTFAGIKNITTPSFNHKPTSPTQYKTPAVPQSAIPIITQPANSTIKNTNHQANKNASMNISINNSAASVDNPLVTRIPPPSTP